MSYLAPYFDPDVFVSYSHGDPVGGRAPLRDWSQALIGRLRDGLALYTGFDSLDIWMDPDIDPTTYLTDDLRRKASACGVLMIIMTNRWLHSPWCRDEVGWFKEQIQDRAGLGARVLLISAQATDTRQWPDFLRDVAGFSFYDPENGIPLGFQDQEPGDEYYKELNRLRLWLAKRLRELRERGDATAAAKKEKRRPLGMAQSAAEAAETAGPTPLGTGVNAAKTAERPQWAPLGMVATAAKAVGDVLSRLIAQFQWEYNSASAAGAEAYRRLRYGRGRSGPELSVAQNSLAAAARGETLDKFGRPLPWRWRRSLSRDLLGPYGLAMIGAAAAITFLSLDSAIGPNFLPGQPDRSAPPAQKPAPSSQPQAQSPDTSAAHKTPVAPPKNGPADLKRPQEGPPASYPPPPQQQLQLRQSDANSGNPGRSPGIGGPTQSFAAPADHGALIDEGICENGLKPPCPESSVPPQRVPSKQGK